MRQRTNAVLDPEQMFRSSKSKSGFGPEQTNGRNRAMSASGPYDQAANYMP